MLPSTIRPREVVEERIAKVAELLRLQREKLKVPKFRISKVFIFKRTMADWYEGLSRKEKRRLRPVDLKRKAVKVCYREQIVYDNLPDDWVTELKEKSGLKWYPKVDKQRPPSEKEKDEKCPEVRHNPRAQRKRKRPERLSMEIKPSQRSPVEEKKDVAVVPVRSSSYKLIDLSTKLPPPAWLEAYAKGIELPRVLTVHTIGDKLVVFYDYNPKLKDMNGKPLVLAPRPRIGSKAVEHLVRNSKEKAEAGRKGGTGTTLGDDRTISKKDTGNK